MVHMTEATLIEDGWLVTQATFSPAEMTAITKLPQPLLRLWRSRGYLPQKSNGRWSKHPASEVSAAYLLHALSLLGVPPSEAVETSATVANDLLFFALVSGDGACDFIGERTAVEKLRRRFEEDFDLARRIAGPSNEQRFVLSQGGPDIWRCDDLCHMIEEERLEYHYCVDLLVAGRSIIERAGRPLYSFAQQGETNAGPRIRRLSHGK